MIDEETGKKRADVQNFVDICPLFFYCIQYYFTYYDKISEYPL